MPGVQKSRGVEGVLPMSWHTCCELFFGELTRLRFGIPGNPMAGGSRDLERRNIFEFKADFRHYGQAHSGPLFLSHTTLQAEIHGSPVYGCIFCRTNVV